MDQQTGSDYAALMALIRTELDRALEPLRKDIQDLKAQQYTREMIDTMLSLRDARITRLEAGPATLATRVAAVISAVWAILSILHIVHF
jgi:hypothetical protein